jgi:hypothetical protein
MRVALKAAELRAIALGRSAGPTRSTKNDWRVGISKALAVPSTNTRASRAP